MLLGASAFGQFTLGGTGYEVGINYVNCAAAIAIISIIQSAIGIAGNVNIAAQIAILSSITASLRTSEQFPEAGVSFTISDHAGGV